MGAEQSRVERLANFMFVASDGRPETEIDVQNEEEGRPLPALSDTGRQGRQPKDLVVALSG